MFVELKVTVHFLPYFDLTLCVCVGGLCGVRYKAYESGNCVQKHEATVERT